MSLGLPEFGSHRRALSGDSFWRAVRTLGLIALVCLMAIAGIEGRSAYLANDSLARARAEVEQARRETAEADRLLQKNPDLLVATASIEAAPVRVQEDLDNLRPKGVSIVALRIDYMFDGTSRVELTIVSGTADAYDRFLSALSQSRRFTDIKPGAESRPGLVRATVVATYLPSGTVPGSDSRP